MWAGLELGGRAAANIPGMHQRSFLDFIRQEITEPPGSVQVLGSTLLTLKVSKCTTTFGEIGSVLVLIQI